MKNKRNTGSILIFSLWLLFILVVFSLTLGRRAYFNLKASQTYYQRLKAYLMAQAGVNKAVKWLKDYDAKNYDGLDETWSTGIDAKTNSDIFSNIRIRDDDPYSFSVHIEDEERRFNINTVDREIIKSIVTEKIDGITDPDALVEDICIQRKKDNQASDEDLKADKYAGFKKASLTVIEELVYPLQYYFKNINQETYLEEGFKAYAILQDYFVCSGDKININTVGEDVLRILVLSCVKAASLSDEATGEITNAILSKRNEIGHFENTKVLSPTFLSLDIKYQTVLAALGNKMSASSDYFKISSEAVLENKNLKRKINCIYYRNHDKIEESKIISWYEQ
ncbi:MAG: type II secretion system protein GspK [Candidatus Omnitrophica bacterium]|nr:type II secretion system protein GspK [Candidatus Omnitrophota bacterium]